MREGKLRLITRAILALCLCLGVFLAGTTTNTKTVSAANSDWTLVNPSGWTSSGVPTDGPVKFVNFNNKLLAISGSSAGLRVWRYGGGSSWTLISNGAFSTGYVLSAVVFNSKIFVLQRDNCSNSSGTFTGCNFIWSSSDGASWQKAAPQNMGNAAYALSPTSNSLIMFNGKLFVGIAPLSGVSSNSLGYLSDTSGANWKQVFTSPLPAIDSATVVSGVLYLSAHGTSADQPLVYQSGDGTSWSTGNTIASNTNGGAAYLGSFGGNIYTAVTSSSNNGLWSSLDGASWAKLSTPPSVDFSGTSVLETAGSGLYIVASLKSGAELWHTTNETTWYSDITNGVGVAGDNTITDVIDYGGYVYAGFVNSGGDQVYSSPAPVGDCKLAITYLFDISGSMTNTLDDGKAQYVAATQAMLSVYDNLAVKNNGSTILRTTTFRTVNPTPSTQAASIVSYGGWNIDTTNPSDRASYANFLSGFSPAAKDVGQQVFGHTPTAAALQATSGTQLSGPSDAIPIDIIVTDGLPNVNLSDPNYTVFPALTSVVLKDKNGNFLDPSQVQAANPGVDVSAVVDMMKEAQHFQDFKQITGNNSNVVTYGIALGGGSKWNPNVVDYFASMSNSDTANRLYGPSSENELASALASITSDACAKAPTLSIQLPPKSLYTPKQLSLTDAKGTNYGFDFNSATGLFSNPSQGSLKVSVTEQNVGTIYENYVIYVEGMKSGNLIAYRTGQKTNQYLAAINKAVIGKAYAQGPSPIDYQLTFVNPPTKAAQDIASFILKGGQTKTNVFLNSSATCSDPSHTTGGYLCLYSILTFRSPEFYTDPLTVWLKDSVNAAPTLTVNGNVSGDTTVQNFSIGGQAVAVGGTVTAPGAAKTLSDYLQTYTNSKITWSSVKSQLETLYSKRTSGTTYGGGATFSGSTWYLNSGGDQPQANNPSSFSAPPEGKLWNVDGDLTINEPVTFNGRGTIVVNGNLTFAGTGGIGCANGSVGFIASGSITFQGTGPYDCGAYVALGLNGTTGSITFPNLDATGMAPWNMILVARNDITLPRILGGDLSINYDTNFANNPTVLFKELLSIIFSSPS